MQFHRELLERSLDIITVLDDEGRVVYESPAFERFFGYPQDALIGQPVLEYIHADDWTAAAAAIGRVRARELETEAVTVRFRHFDGSWRFIEAVGRLWEFDGQSFLLVNTRDVTEKQHILQRLSATNEFLTKTIDSSRNVVSITRADTGEFVEVNQEWLRVSGYERDEVIGRTANELGIWGPAENRDRVLAAVEAGGGRLRDFDVVTHTRNGPRELIINVETLESEGKQLILMTGSDETERRVVEEQLRQAQKMEAVGQLTGGVAHDFNNLLGIILGHAELLREVAAQGGELEPLIEPILQAANRGATLTQQLLAFSRRQVLAPRPVQLDSILTRMQPLLQSTLTPAIALTCSQADALWSCLVDPGQLENALLNLVLNARDALDNDGSIRIEMTNRSVAAAKGEQVSGLEPGDYVTVTVIDDGPGMDEATLARAFEPFFTTKPPGRGTGLGLSMVFGFAHQSGGQAEIDSAPGQGTRVTVWLPRALLPDADLARERPLQRSLHATGDETVLVLEDQPELLNVVQRMLDDRGYRVLPATDAAAALAWLDAGEPISLMLSDIVLAGSRRGPDVALEIRERAPGLPVVYMSGFPATEADGGHLPGAAGPILLKPFTGATLARRIREALDASAAKVN